MTVTTITPSTAARVRARVNVPTLTADGRTVDALVHTFHDLGDTGEHLAVGLGDSGPGATPLVRIHSECLTGDVFGSARCDCGPQLAEAVSLIEAEGGYLLYLRQEGRGIGLYNKLDAYVLQDQGYDTYAANESLGLTADARDYRPAADMLHALGVRSVRLLTNNPEKVEQLRGYGIDVAEQVTTGLFVTPHNRFYLHTKAKVTGHALPLDSLAS